MERSLCAAPTVPMAPLTSRISRDGTSRFLSARSLSAKTRNSSRERLGKTAARAASAATGKMLALSQKTTRCAAAWITMFSRCESLLLEGQAVLGKAAAVPGATVRVQARAALEVQVAAEVMQAP